MIILPLVALLLQTAHASVFENTVLFNFQASRPVSLMASHNASVCATNLDNSPVSILIARLEADTGSLLGTIPAGIGTHLYFVRTVQSHQSQGNVVALVVPNASLTQQCAIVQDRPGSGRLHRCIVANPGHDNRQHSQTDVPVPVDAGFSGDRPARQLRLTAQED